MADHLLTRKKYCRICKGKRLTKFLSLGSMALANAFLSEKALKQKELKFPLDVYLCSDCALVQLVDVVSPKVLFKDYVYVSSTSASFIEHFKHFAQDVWSRFSLPAGSLVVDIGSNDGILLRPFKALGARVLGIEPARKIAQVANENGVETVSDFLSVNLARRVVKTHGSASVVTATNVFAHVDDLDGFVASVKELLKEDGVFIVEAPYLADMIEKNLFDLVYHEHLCYFSLKPLMRLFEQLDMKIFDVQRVSSHGGSLRVFAKRAQARHPIEAFIASLAKQEKVLGFYSLATMRSFARRAAGNKQKLLKLLKRIKSTKATIAGYGAPAKGNTLLNYFGIDTRIIDYIVDDSPWKQGLYTPGTHIPVASAQRLKEDRPDYLLILAWNFAEPIMKKLTEFQSGGGKFIIPVPEPRVVTFQ